MVSAKTKKRSKIAGYLCVKHRHGERRFASLIGSSVKSWHPCPIRITHFKQCVSIINTERPDDLSDNPYSSVNPYQTSVLAENETSGVQAGQARKSISELARWQKFFSVLLCIGLILIVVVFLLQVFLGGSASAVSGLLCGGSVGVIFYGIPALLLWRASAAAKSFAAADSMNQFNDFARAQATLWRVTGILAIIFMIGYVLMMIALVVGIQS